MSAPRRRIDRDPIGEQDDGAGGEQAGAAGETRTVKPDADERIAAGFERGGEKQQEIGDKEIHPPGAPLHRPEKVPLKQATSIP
ncbi:MAG: hypothetical protein WB774_14540 [Xanthobacteraceae bacterium]